ncbi:hypothetical protein MNBD_GAMMA11-1748 [hydrothermal vent metagenome]|uniref:Uncharacterized protein n=1 Tax=hydrothermal vent metagenome TaxID=652676 RepID=A0A3B0XSC1_9ZZZZ
MGNYRLILQVIFKIMAFAGAASLLYVFTVGLFYSPEIEGESEYTFDLSLLADDSGTYFSVNTRELLVIKYQGNFSVFWANDPVYGCRLEYESDLIQPVCIDLKYNLQGYSEDKNQQLLKPDYKIINANQLVVY